MATQSSGCGVEERWSLDRRSFNHGTEFAHELPVLGVKKLHVATVRWW